MRQTLLSLIKIFNELLNTKKYLSFRWKFVFDPWKAVKIILYLQMLQFQDMIYSPHISSMEKLDTMHTIKILHKISKNHTMLLTPTYSMAFFRTFSLSAKKNALWRIKLCYLNIVASLISSINSISRSCSLINFDIWQLRYKQCNYNWNVPFNVSGSCNLSPDTLRKPRNKIA